MTTPNPDGSSNPNPNPNPPPAPTPPSPPAPAPDGSGTPAPAARKDGDSELARVIAQRDRYKDQLDALNGRNAADALKQLQDELEAERAKITQLEADSASKESALQQRDRQDRRGKIVDAVVARAKPDKAGDLKLLLAGLNEEKKIDLYAENVDEGVESIVKHLNDNHPAYLNPATPGPPGSPSGPSSVTPGTDWMDLTPEQQASLSDEEFAKHFGPGADRGRGGFWG